MAVGQQVMSAGLDVVALGAVEVRLEVAATSRSAAHGQRLRDALCLHALLSSAGAGLGTTAHLALVEQVSEHAATALLSQAELLAGLPGGLEAVDCGLLTVEQAAVVARRLLPLSDPVRVVVWRRLRARLLAAFDAQVVLSPARLAELLATWAVEADPPAAVDRRQQAEQHGAVGYRRRDDGLADVFLTGISGPDAQALLCRIRARSAPWGGGDDRSADKRRLDSAVDLLLGRDRLPLDDGTGDLDGADGWHCGPQCGCRNGQPVPCGVGVTVLVPLAAALGTSDDVAHLEGHGPLEPDLLQAVLGNGAVLRAAWVDVDGTPVAVADRTESPPRGDATAVRQALLRLAAGQPPGPFVPRHPEDHGPPQPTVDRLHPSGAPGRYRPSARLARLVRARSPRCEWPGCGHRSAHCDLDHDRAHPAGPTCGCNLGPLCRRHHRLKQLLLAKARTEGSVVWTSPTGRRWTSPSQHTPPLPAVRDLPPLPDPTSDDEPEPDGDTDLDWHSGRVAARREARLPTDPYDRPDVEDDTDPYLRVDQRGWGLALDDPTRWGC